MKHYLIITLTFLSCCSAFAQKDSMMIRISEIEIDSNYLEEYKAILKEESSASVKLEPWCYCYLSNVSKRRTDANKNTGNIRKQASLPVAFKNPAFSKI